MSLKERERERERGCLRRERESERGVFVHAVPVVGGLDEITVSPGEASRLQMDRLLDENWSQSPDRSCRGDVSAACIRRRRPKSQRLSGKHRLACCRGKVCKVPLHDTVRAVANQLNDKGIGAVRVCVSVCVRERERERP